MCGFEHIFVFPQAEFGSVCKSDSHPMGQSLLHRAPLGLGKLEGDRPALAWLVTAGCPIPADVSLSVLGTPGVWEAESPGRSPPREHGLSLGA